MNGRAAGQTLVVVTHDESLGRSGQRLVEVRDGLVVGDQTATHELQLTAPAVTS